MREKVIDVYKVDRRTTMDKIKTAINEYFGPIPVLSGIVGASAVQGTALLLGMGYETMRGTTEFINAGDMDLIANLYRVPGAIWDYYLSSKDFASNWYVPGFVVGQFTGYTFKRKVSSIFKKIREGIFGG